MENKLETKSGGSGLKISRSLIIALIVLSSGVLGFTAYYAITKAGSTQPAPVVTVTPNKPSAISSLGRLEPQGEMVKVAPPSALGSSRIARLLVKEGDSVQQDQVIAVLDSFDRAQAAVSRQKVRFKLSKACWNK